MIIYIFRMKNGLIKVNLITLILIIGTGVSGCKKAEDYYNRGDARFKKGETDGAIADFTKAIEKNPRFANACYYRGMAYHRKKDYDRVISDYTKAVEINPRFAVAYAERALIYFIQKEYDKSWQDVHKAESLGLEVRQGFREALEKASGRKQ
jgi:tetratricopeptide (TPR) repeat protein